MSSKIDNFATIGGDDDVLDFALNMEDIHDFTLTHEEIHNIVHIVVYEWIFLESILSKAIKFWP